jgi:hypothetical protein
VPLLLRKLDRLLAWDLDNPSAYPWLRVGDFQADPLSDLTTSSNAISVYSIEQADEANLLRIAAALTIGRGKYDRFDYVLFPETIVSGLGLQLINKAGNTADAQVNEFHRDISDVSAQRLVELVERIFRTSEKFGTIGERQLIGSIIEGLQQKRIKRKSVANWNRFCERAEKHRLVPPEE